MTPDGGLLWTILKNRDNTLTQIAFLLGDPEAAPSNGGPGNRRFTTGEVLSLSHQWADR